MATLDSEHKLLLQQLHKSTQLNMVVLISSSTFGISKMIAGVTLCGMLLLGSTLGAPSGSGNVYLYPCGNCKCDATQSVTGFTGSTGCLDVNDQTAVGLTRSGGYETTCSLYSQPGCQGDAQSAGVYSGESWGCTAGNNRILSVQCYYNV